MPSSSLIRLAVMAAIVIRSMYSRIVRVRPDADDARHRRRHLVERGERHQHVAARGSRGTSLSVTSVTSASVPSEPITSWVRS
jgi:hypothetical protein